MSLYLGETPICGGIEGNQLNNPFSLLDYKFSEYELSNASWLRSNGQWNSGEVYSSVYNLLQGIYNETTTKAGVSVKLSTETYADTDFVLNTSDTTFRLPIKVALASGKAVAGNGMTLGLTDGTNNVGLTNNNYSFNHNFSTQAVYGTNIGTATAQTGLATIDRNISLGITLDPTKSGIETSANGLYLYFYVGAVVQDASVIAASQVLSDIAELKRRAFGAPDWNNAVNLSSLFPYTCPDEGILYLRNYNGYIEITSNLATIFPQTYVISGTGSANNSGEFRVQKGEILTLHNTSGNSSYFFVPFKI